MSLTDRFEQVAARKAAILSALPAELHDRAKGNAMTLTNVLGGIHSDNLHNAVAELRDLAAAERLDQPTYAERYTAEWRAAR